MMTAIRSAAANWLGRAVLIVIMGLLIVSFAIWGIGDIFRGGATRNVANVGGEPISAEAYRNAFNTELQNVQRRIRRPLSTNEARAFGLDREILNRMIDDATLSAKANRLGLALDEAGVSQSVLEADIFQTGGRFDRERYLSLLQQSGLSEPAFLRQQGEFLLRQQLVQGLVGGFDAPATFSAALHQYREEQRNLDVVMIPQARVPDPANPTPEELRAFHEERRAEFRTIETRQVTILTVSPQIFAADVTLSEAELRAFYEEAVANGRFGTPERRRAFRLLFESEALAREAADRLAGGLAFEALMAEKNVREADIDLGLVTRAQVPDSATREAIFALAEGRVSAPIRDPFGFVLLKVAKIEPGQAAPFEQVRLQVEFDARSRKLATDPGVKSKVDDLVRRIEDQRIAGKSLTEAGQVTGLAPLVIEALARDGNGPDGQRLNVPGGMETVNAVFGSDIGLDNEALHLRDGSHVWFEVNRVDPARDKAFEEVEADIRARFSAEQKSRAMGEFASGLLKRIEAGENLAAIAGELGAPVQVFAGLRRNASEPVLGRDGVERAFAGPIGKAVSAIAPDQVGRMLILPKTASLLPHDATADAGSAIARQISQGMADDIFRQYVTALRKEAGVSINEALIAETLGQAN